MQHTTTEGQGRHPAAPPASVNAHIDMQQRENMQRKKMHTKKRGHTRIFQRCMRHERHAEQRRRWDACGERTPPPPLLCVRHLAFESGARREVTDGVERGEVREERGAGRREGLGLERLAAEVRSRGRTEGGTRRAQVPEQVPSGCEKRLGRRLAMAFLAEEDTEGRKRLGKRRLWRLGALLETYGKGREAETTRGMEIREAETTRGTEIREAERRSSGAEADPQSAARVAVLKERPFIRPPPPSHTLVAPSSVVFRVPLRSPLSASARSLLRLRFLGSTCSWHAAP